MLRIIICIIINIYIIISIFIKCVATQNIIIICIAIITCTVIMIYFILTDSSNLVKHHEAQNNYYIKSEKFCNNLFHYFFV